VRCRTRRLRRPCNGEAMKDLIFVVVVVLFFVLSWLYVRACERI
jgi:hypothetical protein